MPTSRSREMQQSTIASGLGSGEGDQNHFTLYIRVIIPFSEIAAGSPAASLAAVVVEIRSATRTSAASVACSTMDGSRGTPPSQCVVKLQIGVSYSIPQREGSPEHQGVRRIFRGAPPGFLARCDVVTPEGSELEPCTPSGE